MIVLSHYDADNVSAGDYQPVWGTKFQKGVIRQKQKCEGVGNTTC